MTTQRQEYENEPDDWEEREEANNEVQLRVHSETKVDEASALIVDDRDSDDNQENRA